MSHTAAPGQVTDATIGPRATRALAIVGAIVVLAAVIAYGWLIGQGVNHPATLTGLNSDLHRTYGRGGTSETSTLITVIAVSILGFLLGAFCLGLADISRRRVAPATQTRGASIFAESGFQYPVRPIGVGWHLLWIVLLAGGWMLSYALPNALGLLVPRSSGYGFLLVLLLFPLTLSSIACFAAIASLIKKLGYASQLRRHPDHPTSAKRGALRTFLFLWRGDLGLAAIGGLLAGISIWPATTGYGIVAVGFIFWGALFLMAGLLFGRQFWRTGEPLAVVTVSRPPASSSLYR